MNRHVVGPVITPMDRDVIHPSNTPITIGRDTNRLRPIDLSSRVCFQNAMGHTVRMLKSFCPEVVGDGFVLPETRAARSEIFVDISMRSVLLIKRDGEAGQEPKNSDLNNLL